MVDQILTVKILKLFMTTKKPNSEASQELIIPNADALWAVKGCNLKPIKLEHKSQ